MRLSDIGLDLIRRFEGFSPGVYLDAAGLPTIGYGHLVRKGEVWPTSIDEKTALLLLRNDVTIAERGVSRWIAAPLTQHQYDALVSFTFNLGAGTLQRSTLRRVLNRGEYEAVEEPWLRYVWAGGKKLSGLVRRRKAELQLFVSD